MICNDANIKTTSYADVYGKIKICDKNSFTVQFVNLLYGTSIGIVDEEYKK